MSAARTIALDQACAGMVLAADLLDAGGAVLLPGGAALSETNLASLRRRGVASCSVLATAATPPADPLALQREQERLRLRLMRLFRHSAADQATPLLLQLLLDYRQHG